MIDTVVLVLPKGSYVMTSPSGLDARRYMKASGFVIDTYFCKKYRASCKKEGRYFPDIKVQRNKGQEVLEIQVSLPKLLFGSSLFEVRYDDFDLVIEKLVKCCAEIGLHIGIKEMSGAIIKKVDFAKNIIFPSYYGSAQYIIRKLSLFNHKRSSLFENKSYGHTEQGASVGYWNTTQRYSIYDKLKEIASNGYTNEELSLIQEFQAKHIPYPIIRFEFSLKRKVSLNKYLKQRMEGVLGKVTLYDLFHARGGHDILLEVYNEVFGSLNISLINASEMKDNDLLYQLGQMRLGMPKETKMYYWVNIVTKFGLHQAMKMIDQKYRGGSRRKVKAELEEFLNELQQNHNNTLGLMDFLHEQHQKRDYIRPNNWG